ncbi:putative rsec15 [Wallemia mellicola]|nr:putative rsec15 [Wallemia mellicola]TIC72324.1 putative rsec15 [Wallemia mellicola]
MNDPLTTEFNYEQDFKYDESNDEEEEEEFIYQPQDNLEEPEREVSQQFENSLQLNTSGDKSDDEVIDSLFKAASIGDIDTLTLIQPSFTQSNETNKRSGITPLHAASTNGHLDAVKYLIEEAGAIVELEDREGETALLRASHKPSNIPIVTYLLSIGANVAHADNDGWNALHNASANGSEDAVRIILNNANKSIIDSLGGLQAGPGYTALMNAASRGHLDVVRFLLTEASAPADPFIRNKSGATAYSLAAESLHFDICEFILNAEKALVKDPLLYNPLEYHQSVPIYLLENQRLDCRLSTLAKTGGVPRWSNSGLGQGGRRPKWELPDSRPVDLSDPFNDVQIPSIAKPFTVNLTSISGKPSSNRGAYFWTTDDWLVWKSIGKEDGEGWMYAHDFSAPNSEWKINKTKEIETLEKGSGVGSIKATQMFGGRTGKSGSKTSASENVDKNYWVRRRRWVRILQRDPTLTLPYNSPELKIPKSKQVEMTDIGVQKSPKEQKLKPKKSQSIKKSHLNAKSTPFNPANAITRKRPHYNEEDIKAQLSQVHLIEFDSSNAQDESLELLGPILKNINESQQERDYIKALDAFITEKDSELEEQCKYNYQDFVSSVKTLLGTKGRSNVLPQKKELLEINRVHNNINDATETMQAFQRVLELMKRVDELIANGKYYAALRSLDDLAIYQLPPLANYTLGAHLLESIPAMRQTVCDSASFELKDWLLGIRNVQRVVGGLALSYTNERQQKWRTKKLSDPVYARSGINSPLELVMNQDDFDPLDNDQVSIDFKPLLHCIHIYDALAARADLRKAYQEDRKSQADLILSARSNEDFSESLQQLLQDVVGFFIIEKHVLGLTNGFRSEINVDDLWDLICSGISNVVREGLRTSQSYLKVKENVMTFIWTLERYEFDVQQLNTLLHALFEEYTTLLHVNYKRELETVFKNSDQQALVVDSTKDLESVLEVCWVDSSSFTAAYSQKPPIHLPFSSIYPEACKLLRRFIDDFYKYTEGFSQIDTDSLIASALDRLIKEGVVKTLSVISEGIYNLSQAVQLAVDTSHLELAAGELTNLLTALHGALYDKSRPTSELECKKDVRKLSQQTLTRINTLIANKLDSLFEMAEMELTPDFSSSLKTDVEPSEYLREMTDYLSFISSSTLTNLPSSLREQAYTNSVQHIAEGILDLIVGSEVDVINEHGLDNVRVDVNYLMAQSIDGRDPPTLVELDQILRLIKLNHVQAYFESSTFRRSKYANVTPKMDGRQISVYKPYEKDGNRLEYPESYYEPTSSELARAHTATSKRLESQYEGPLKTKAIREKEERQRKAKWPTTKIRIKFSDRSIIQSEFNSVDQIGRVYDFVKLALDDKYINEDFLLYQSPPRIEFKVTEQKSLIDLGLAPSSILMIKFANESLNATNSKAPLKGSLVESADSLPTPPSFDTPMVEQKEKKKVETEDKKEKKIPKWLLKGLKKFHHSCYQMSKNAYDRHKQWKYEQEKIYRRDFNLEAERDKGVTEFDLIKQNHKFLKDEDLYDSDEEVKETTEEVTDPYAQKLSDKYYDSLYKEFAIADLKHYKTQISLRWRTKQEVVDGVGEKSCANIRCMTRESKLIPFELPFNYKENDIAKNAEVKVVLCLASAVLGQSKDYPGVVSQNENGPTNPDTPELDTDTPEDSEARLLTINNIDDFCIFGPKDADQPIGDTEAEQVAWCTQPRNNARLIPEGTFSGVHFTKTPYYIQLQGWGDLTKIGVKDGDYGGELDPHGAKDLGNPIGGNVTSNISGEDTFYEEWMEFISFEQFCLRVCTAGDDEFPAAVMCEHKLDIMGCGFVMPGDYSEKNFQTCDADAAYPPGIYPVEDGSYSSFAQRWTGTITQTDGVETVITVGDTETPSTVPMTPSSSNCVTQSSLNMYVESESESSSPKPTSNNSSSNDDSSAPKSAVAGVILTFSIAGLSALAILS